MATETTRKQFSTDRVLLAVRSHGLQKQLAIELEIVCKGYVGALRRALKEEL